MEQKRIKLVIVVLLIVGVLAVGSFMLNENNNLTNEAEIKVNEEEIGLDIGDYPPDFTLETLAGKEVNLYDYHGQNVVINFWASWCPPCREEMPTLDSFNNKYDDTVVLAVNVRENKQTVSDYITDGGYQFPVLLDKTAAVAREYAITVFPTTYFVNSKGRIEYIKRGLVTESELEGIYEGHFTN